jgi:glycosyltransferase involved in cell wall biosynthesis
LRVSLDARLLGHAGIGRFIEGLWPALLRAGVDVVALKAPPGRAGWREAGGADAGPAEVVASRPFLPAEQAVLPGVLRRLGVGVHHSTHLSVPYLARVPVVLTVHDLFPVHWPWHARSRAAWAYYRVAFPAALRRADAVVAVSPYTAREIQDLLPVPEDKLRVIEHGMDLQAWRPAPGADRIEVLGRLGVTTPYVLYSGTVKRHKNLGLLARAWRSEFPPLVLAGPSSDEVETAVPELAALPHVRALGRVATDDLVALYSAAEAVVLPSHHESVGFVALEAMACGVPLVSSDGGCLPETVGPAGLLVPPGDPAGWGEAIASVLGDAERRNSLVAAGMARVSTRSWEAAAASYGRLYGELG